MTAPTVTPESMRHDAVLLRTAADRTERRADGAALCEIADLIDAAAARIDGEAALVMAARAVDRADLLDVLHACGIAPAGIMSSSEDCLAIRRYVEELQRTITAIIAELDEAREDRKSAGEHIASLIDERDATAARLEELTKERDAQAKHALDGWAHAGVVQEERNAALAVLKQIAERPLYDREGVTIARAYLGLAREAAKCLKCGGGNANCVVCGGRSE